MLQHTIIVKDQFGIKHDIQATMDRQFMITQCYSHLKHITVDGEDIRPSFEMFFQSTLTGKIYMIL